MRKPRKLRAPFVATFAIAAGACGGRVDHVDSSEPPPTPTTNPPAQVECPASEPPSGGQCNVADQKCTYGNCNGSPTTEAVCSGFLWRVAHSSCNPPAQVCPATEPTAGAACSIGGMTCPYHQNECDEAHGYQSPIAFTCTAGAWQVSGGGSCNPPPPLVCPTAPPQDGAPCYGDLKCPYGDCYGYPTTQAVCNGTTWQVSVSSCNPPVVDAGSG